MNAVDVLASYALRCALDDRVSYEEALFTVISAMSPAEAGAEAAAVAAVLNHLPRVSGDLPSKQAELIERVDNTLRDQADIFGHSFYDGDGVVQRVVATALLYEDKIRAKKRVRMITSMPFMEKVMMAVTHDKATELYKLQNAHLKERQATSDGMPYLEPRLPLDVAASLLRDASGHAAQFAEMLQHEELELDPVPGGLEEWHARFGSTALDGDVEIYGVA